MLVRSSRHDSPGQLLLVSTSLRVAEMDSGSTSMLVGLVVVASKQLIGHLAEDAISALCTYTIASLDPLMGGEGGEAVCGRGG
jgi:hypothetical protein